MLEESYVVRVERCDELDVLDRAQRHYHIGSKILTGPRGRRKNEALIVRRIRPNGSTNQGKRESAKEKGPHYGRRETARDSLLTVQSPSDPRVRRAATWTAEDNVASWAQSSRHGVGPVSPFGLIIFVSLTRRSFHQFDLPPPSEMGLICDTLTKVQSLSSCGEAVGAMKRRSTIGALVSGGENSFRVDMGSIEPSASPHAGVVKSLLDADGGELVSEDLTTTPTGNLLPQQTQPLRSFVAVAMELNMSSRLGLVRPRA